LLIGIPRLFKSGKSALREIGGSGRNLGSAAPLRNHFPDEHFLRIPGRMMLLC